LSSCLTSSFLIGTGAMATESEAGVKLPPGVGILGIACEASYRVL